MFGMILFSCKEEIKYTIKYEEIKTTVNNSYLLEYVFYKYESDGEIANSIPAEYYANYEKSIKSLIVNNDFNIKMIPLFNSSSNVKEGILIYTDGPDHKYNVEYSEEDSITFRDIVQSDKFMNLPLDYKKIECGGFDLSYDDYANKDFYEGKDLLLHIVSFPHHYYNVLHIFEDAAIFYDEARSGKRIRTKTIRLFLTKNNVKKTASNFEFVSKGNTNILFKIKNNTEYNYTIEDTLLVQFNRDSIVWYGDKLICKDVMLFPGRSDM